MYGIACNLTAFNPCSRAEVCNHMQSHAINAIQWDCARAHSQLHRIFFTPREEEMLLLLLLLLLLCLLLLLLRLRSPREAPRIGQQRLSHTHTDAHIHHARAHPTV